VHSLSIDLLFLSSNLILFVLISIRFFFFINMLRWGSFVYLLGLGEKRWNPIGFQQQFPEAILKMNELKPYKLYVKFDYTICYNLRYSQNGLLI
jgi:hypothetical protein